MMYVGHERPGFCLLAICEFTKQASTPEALFDKVRIKIRRDSELVEYRMVTQPSLGRYFFVELHHTLGQFS